MKSKVDSRIRRRANALAYKAKVIGSNPARTFFGRKIVRASKNLSWTSVCLICLIGLGPAASNLPKTWTFFTQIKRKKNFSVYSGFGLSFANFFAIFS